MSNIPPSQHPAHDAPGSPPQSIPLQNLPRSTGEDDSHTQRDGGATRGSNNPYAARTSMGANPLAISFYWEQSLGPQQQHDIPDPSPISPIDPLALQFALPPEIHPPTLHPPAPSIHSVTSVSTNPYATSNPSYEEIPSQEFPESDSAPLTSSVQPISGALATPQLEPQSRTSFQTVSSLDDGSSPGPRDTKMLGYDLEANKHRTYGNSLSPIDHRVSRSPGAAFSKAGSIVRAMSQRVVNISGEAESIEQQQRRSRSRSRSPSADGRASYEIAHSPIDTSYPSQVYPSSPAEKGDSHFSFTQEPAFAPRGPMPNPLKGRTLGIFGPENPIRKGLCEVLVNPYMEPLILILIVCQAVLLVIEAAPNVFNPGNGRPARWGESPYDWAMLVLFAIFTLEIIARIIVSGFLWNAPEYSTIDRDRGIRAAMIDRYKAAFGPERQKSVKGRASANYGPTLARSFATMHGQILPETVEEQQRLQLARRAFLRHSFNRMDFTAVVSFWITFFLSISGVEMGYHLYIFRMLSCLRIVRLLALTNGTAIILRSLKKAAPLLLRVSFLICFFWIVFAIIGIQSFKSSLSRTCVWLDPSQPSNLSAGYNNEFQFCGGYLDNSTGNEMPWVYSNQPGSIENLINGSTSPKGFICPKGSLCLEQTGPYNNTVNFDNIAQSVELVFVIMSANTWSDIMYYTTNSDYLPAAFFFAAGIMIMMLWMTNLLIAVITSSFQVIREESKSSAFTADAQDALAPVQLDQPHLQRASALQRIYNKTSIVWVIVIAVDLFVQAFRDVDDRNANFIQSTEILATSLLDVEILIRFAADWRGFHRSTRNLFDLFLAASTTIILFPPIRNSGQVYAWLTVVQILRVYRVVLAIPITRKLILVVLGNAAGIGNLMLFVFMITLLMAIMAVQLFREEIPMYDSQGNFIRISFYNIYNAFLGMYQILSSENWTAILYEVTAFTKAKNTAWYGAIFLIGWFVLSFFILVNMFIAVIQENFDVSEDEKRLEQVKAFLQKKELGNNSSNLALSTIFSWGRNRKKRDPLDYGPATMEMLLKDAVVKDFLDDTMDPLQQTTTEVQSPPQSNESGEVRPGKVSSVWGKIRALFTNREPNPFYSNLRFDAPNDTLDPRQMARQAVSATAARRKAQREYLARHPTYNNALYIFKPDNRLRRLCQRLVGPGRGNERFNGVEPNKIAWYSFSAFIYAAIVAMVVLACVTTPLYQREYFLTHDFHISNWFVWVDMGFATVFTAEAVIKVIADGLFFTPNAYFRSSWGIIDGIVLITLWINVGTLLANDGAVSRAVGAFKALRALRLLNVSDSARDTFHSLIVAAGGKILGAAFVSISLLIPFAIYAVTLFNGQLVSCNDSSSGIDNLVDCFGEFNSTPFNNNWPMLAPRVASNPYYSFDDFASSLFVLFQIVSQEGWVDVSFSAQSITGRGLQPQNLAAPGNAVFFVVFNLMATVFVLTLFISVFMRNYTEQTGVAFLTAEQRSWLELRKRLRQISPSKSSYDESEKQWKKWCHKRAIEKRGRWYTTVTFVLVFHFILLALEFQSEPEWWTRTRDVILLLFTLIYIANNFIRIVGLGWARFRRSSWDVFSLVAVSGAFFTSILLLAEPNVESFIQLYKLFLVAIVLLLIPRNDALDQLFKTAAASLTTIINLLATWLVFFLLFAIALTQIFSLTRFGANEAANSNFRTVPKALVMLLRFSCGEGWNQIMEDYASIQPPLCVETDDFSNSDCGSTAWARTLFIAWNLISMYIFVNLFISLIYESFSYVYQRSSGLAHVDRHEIRRFKEAWRSVDPAGTGFISKEQFPRLLGELSGVFEMRIYDPEDSVKQILEDVRGGDGRARHASIASTSTLSSGIDLQKLNERIARIDVEAVQERRRRFNIFFEEAMVSADPDRGISFTSVLMILAHYNIISDSKSLRLDEFLRRRARLQRVEEEVRRRIVVGFFDTLYWMRRFKKQVQKKKSARLETVPQLGVPDIFVDEESDKQKTSKAPQRTTLAVPPTRPRARSTSSDFLSASDAVRPQHQTWNANTSAQDGSSAHPLSTPRSSLTVSAGHHGGRTSAFSFELQESEGAPSEDSRRGSSVSPAQVRELLDNSVWVESIRRGATVRQSRRRRTQHGHH